MIRIKNRLKWSLSTTHILMLSFISLILIGSILLSLPISTQNGERVPYIDALFTATTATCVTGLVTVSTFATWSTFGHIVILILIQIGGLGVITAIAGVAVFMHKRLGLANNILICDTLNLNSMSGVANFLKRAILGTFLVEGIGALLYMTVFIPEFGWAGIWISIFTSISAFCNAGIDIIANDSLCRYVNHPMINFVTCALIVVSGIGYIVWFDVIDMIKHRKVKKMSLKNLTLHSKIALASTFGLVVIGAALILIFEFNNMNTIGHLSLFDKIQASLFQSITTRTAGFFTVPQENLTNSSTLVCFILMFIGGSPVGTAGGVKTVTFIVLFASALATIRNKNDVNLFNRRLGKDVVRKSLSVIVMSFSIMALSTIALSMAIDANITDLLYETVSASATVGLSRNLTGSLNLAGKIIIIITMYLGRIGPISLAVATNVKKENKNMIKNPVEEISVG